MLDYISMMTTSLGRAVSRATGSPPAWRPLGALAMAALVGCGGSSGPPDADAPIQATPDPNAVVEPVELTPAPAGGGVETPAPSTPEVPAFGPGIYAGNYHVPVPAELEPYADFEIVSVRLDVRGGELVLKYDLPELLIGEARGLSFRGAATPDGSYVLEGDDGTATCRSSADGWTCDEALFAVQLDVEKIERLLDSMSDAEAIGRRSVADRFSVDPIGVLQIASP
jgi:hypothetical protein